MTSTNSDILVCPDCGSRAIGRIGNRQYYCRDCCIEFLMNQDGTVELFTVQPDGTLESLGTREVAVSE